MKKKLVAMLGIAVAFAMILTACGGVPKLTGIAVPDEMLNLEMDVGETTVIDLVKTFTPENVTEEQITEALAAANLTWESDNPEVVAITPDDSGGGTIEAVAPGTANVVVSGGDENNALLLTIKVTVLEPVVPITDIEVPEELAVYIQGEELGSGQLEVVVLPEDATDVAVSYISDNEDVATVSDDGIVTAAAPGEATITTTVTGAFDAADVESMTFETKVTVGIAAEGITLDSTEGWIYVGGVVQLDPHTTPAEAAAHTYTYTTSDASVATVSDDGTITGIKVGTATITVTSVEDPELTATYTITINAASTRGNRGASSTGGNGGGMPIPNGGGNENNGGEGNPPAPAPEPTTPSTPASEPTLPPAPEPEPDIPYVPVEPGNTENIGGL